MSITKSYILLATLFAFAIFPGPTNAQRVILPETPNKDKISSIHASADDKLLLIEDIQAYYIYDVATGNFMRRIQKLNNLGPSGFRFSPSYTKYIATNNYGDTGALFSTSSGKLLEELPYKYSSFSVPVYNEDESKMFISANNGLSDEGVVFDIGESKEVQRFPGYYHFWSEYLWKKKAVFSSNQLLETGTNKVLFQWRIPDVRDSLKYIMPSSNENYVALMCINPEAKINRFTFVLLQMDNEEPVALKSDVWSFVWIDSATYLLGFGDKYYRYQVGEKNGKEIATISNATLSVNREFSPNNKFLAIWDVLPRGKYSGVILNSYSGDTVGRFGKEKIIGAIEWGKQNNYAVVYYDSIEFGNADKGIKFSARSLGRYSAGSIGTRGKSAFIGKDKYFVMFINGQLTVVDIKTGDLVGDYFKVLNPIEFQLSALPAGDICQTELLTNTGQQYNIDWPEAQLKATSKSYGCYSLSGNGQLYKEYKFESNAAFATWKTVNVRKVVNDSLQCAVSSSRFNLGLKFSNNSKYGLYSPDLFENDDKIEIWDLDVCKKNGQVKAKPDMILPVVWMGKSNQFCIGNSDAKTIKVFDAAKASTVQTYYFKEEISSYFSDSNGQYLYVVADAHDKGNSPSIGAEYRAVYKYRLPNMTPDYAIHLPTSWMSYSMNSKATQLIGIGIDTLAIIDLEKGTLNIAETKMRGSWKELSDQILFFDNDAMALLVTNHDSLAVYDFANSKVKYYLPTNFMSYKGVQYVRQCGLLILISNDGRFDVYQFATGEYVGTYLLKSDLYGEVFSIFLDRNGYYKCPKGNLNGLGCEMDGHVYDVKQFDVLLNRPDTVLQRIGLADIDKLNAYKNAYHKRMKRAAVSLQNDFKHVPTLQVLNEDSLLVTVYQDFVEFSVKASDSSYGISKLSVTVNGVPVNNIENPTGNPKTFVARLPIKLSSGANTMHLIAQNNHGFASLEKTYHIMNNTKHASKPTLHVIAVGASDFPDKTYNLKYSLKDCRDFVSMMQQKGKDIYQNVIVDTLFNDNATKEKILKLKGSLIATDVNDKVVVLISGHGMNDNNGNFYFATGDIDFKKPALNGLSYDSIEWLLEGIPARNKLLLMDACFSGEVDKAGYKSDAPKKAVAQNVVSVGPKGIAVQQETFENSFVLMQDLFSNLSNQTGTIVISAAAGDSYAYESDDWHNGVFTYSLLQLAKAPPSDSIHVTVSKLHKYLVETVSKLTADGQRPNTRAENLDNDWVLW